MTLALAYDIDALADKAPAPARGLADAPAEQQRAVHLHHRLRGAQGQPEGHPGLGRPRAARRRGHHAEPEDLRRRALELPGRLGLRAARRPAATRRRRGSSSPASSRTCRCSTPGRAAPPPPSPSAASATCSSPGRTRRSSLTKEVGKDQFEIVVPSVSILAEPPVAVVDKVRRQARHARRGGGLPRSSSTPTEGQEIAAKHYFRPRSPDGRREARQPVSPACSLFTIDEVFGGWAQGAEGALRRRRHLRPALSAEAR